MRLKNFTDYSLRVLIYLSLKEQGLSTVSEISEKYDISVNHLVKVVHNLTKMNLIKSFKGRNGGLKLSRHPEKINLGKVMRELEKSTYLIECFDPEGRCKINPVCKLKSVLSHAESNFYKTFDSYTLADILTNSSQLKKRLQVVDIASA